MSCLSLRLVWSVIIYLICSAEKDKDVEKHGEVGDGEMEQSKRFGGDEEAGGLGNLDVKDTMESSRWCNNNRQPLASTSSTE